MDPGGSELDSSLPHPENPCLIVEDSQPDSVALEDDPESSYRALLARRLSSLQPTSRSPVLELISSPLGGRSSQTDSQSESSQNNNQADPDTNANSAFQEESQVLNICSLPNNRKCSSVDTEMESGADSTTHCIQSEEGNSQFGFIQLSQSQDLGCEEVNSQENVENTPEPATGTHSKSAAAEQITSCGASGGQDSIAARSEVSSSSLTESSCQSAKQLSIQVLLHSKGQQGSGRPENQDAEILSSQEDLFDADKPGTAVDSTVSEPEQQGQPTSTPAHTLRLLHLSGQEALAQESLSQSSVDIVAPTPDHCSPTPLIVPSSPTDAENPQGSEEPMDTLQHPEVGPGEKEEEPMETDAAPKPQPVSSTPVSQHSPVFVLDQALSLPSQPEFSHDVFVPTQSQEAAQQSSKKTESLSVESQRPRVLPLQLSMNTPGGSQARHTFEEVLEDSQDTQIEEPEELPVTPCQHQCSETNRLQAESQTATGFKPCSKTSLNVNNVNVKECEAGIKESSSGSKVSCSQSKLNSPGITVNICVQETSSDMTPCSSASMPVISQTSTVDVAAEAGTAKALSQDSATVSNSQMAKDVPDEVVVEEEVLMDEEESTVGGGTSRLALALSQSQLVSPEPMEEESQDRREDSVVMVTDSVRDSQALPQAVTQDSKTNSSQPVRGNIPTSTNGHESLAQMKDKVPEPDGLKDKSLSDSSGEISFHFTLPKEGELIGPVVGVTPPLMNQLKRTLRHSTPIEITSFSEKSNVVGDVSAEAVMAASDIVSAESGDDTIDTQEGKLSLRMKLVTPVEESSSERFSLQKPTLSDEDGSVVKVTTVTKAVTSPSVFTRVRQVLRQHEAEDQCLAVGNTAPVRGDLIRSPQRTSQSSWSGCNSLPNCQSEPSQEVFAEPQETTKDPPGLPEQSGERQGSPEPPTPNRTEARQKAVNQQTVDITITSSPTSKRTVSQQTNSEDPGTRPAGRGEPETPSFRRTTGPFHRRHVRTIQEVRTTITRIITDVYYEDGKEVDRRVTEESEEPVVDCHVMDSDISPCRTGSSLTSGDLGDISSLSSKASSQQHSSGGTSSTAGHIRPDFIMPLSRGTRSIRSGGGSSLPRYNAQIQPLSSSEDEPYGQMVPPRLPISPTDAELPSHSGSLRSPPEEASSASCSFVGLRVVAKWSSNGYFYSGRIIKDAGEGRFRLRFDDGYECEVAGKDILLCDPIPMETEVTALLEDEYFSIGVVKGYKTEGQELYYSVEKEGQNQWYNRTSVILSLEQGNKLREQHSLGPYEPSTPLAKASDISLDNLVEGKRRRRGNSTGPDTPSRSSCSSPRIPGPAGKRKLKAQDDKGTPAKRGRRGPGSRAGQRAGVCNTSGSGTDLPGQSADPAETHGPLPHNTALFMGFAFMLTASSEIDRLTNKLTSDDEEDYVETGPYNKGYTESQLQAGGGFILPDFNEEQCKAAYQSLLIADQHCRTRKYLLCLASGVPCVSHIWVRDCCKDNKLLNYRNYLLPAGVGPDDAIVEWHPRCSPFKALRVLVVLEKPVELWVQLLTLGGGSSVRHFQANKDTFDIPAGKYDVVLTDETCPPLLDKSFTSQEIPLVSPEWLIQSVICGERLGFDSKPQYHHDYSS